MNITKFAIERNRASLTLILFFLLGGLLAFFDMPRAKDPDFIVRTAVVNTAFPGATPRRVESLVTKPLEKYIKQIEEINYIRSSSSAGVSSITVHILSKYKDIAPIWTKLQKKIDEGARELPPEASVPFLNNNFDTVYGTMITLVGEGFSYSELDAIAKNVKEEFLRIEEVGKVELFGLQQEKIYVEFSNAKLAEVGLSPAALGNIIRKRNIITPGGAITYGPQRLSLEPTGNLRSIEELGKTIVPLPGNSGVVYLEDIVTIKKGYSDPRDPITRQEKEGAIVLAVSVSPGANILDLGDLIKEKITYLEQQYPIGIEFKVTFDEPELVAYIIDNFIGSLIMAVIIVMAVMFATLGWRTSLIVSTLIPSTILMAFFFMSLLHITLNQVSLAALIIALGLLVDNAIVMTEAVMVRLDEGEDPMLASINAAKELSISLFTSTITTAAAFLPIYLAQSAASEYTSALFEVVSITLVSSWILSMTLTPLMSYLFLRPAMQFSYDNPLCNAFKDFLVVSLKWRNSILVFTLLLFLSSLYAFNFIPKSFFPAAEQPSFLVQINMPSGSSINRTLEKTMKMEEYLDQFKGELITNYTSFVGKGAPRFWVNYTPQPKSSEYAEILINTVSIDAIDELKELINIYGKEHFEDALIKVKKLDNGPPQSDPMQIRISGNDDEILYKLVNDTKAELLRAGLVINTNDDWGTWSENLVINIKPALAYHAGVSYSDIANSLKTALSGDVITQFRADQKTIPIVMRSHHTLHEDYNMLRSTLVFVPSTGRSVPLTQVAEIEMVWKPPTIISRNGKHTITVTGEMPAGSTAFSVSEEITKYLDKQDWPIGYHYEMGGKVESSKIAIGSIANKLPIAIMIILLVIMMQFNSFSNTTIILTTIPLAIIGVVIGLLVTKTSFAFMSFLGVISLIGIVINNAIILIERIESEIDKGLKPQDAIVEAAQRRMRPILLTTMTTIGGLVPLWISGGPMWQPMAIAIIFGIGFSTMLTLGIVPILYSVFNKIKFDKDYQFVSANTCALR